MPNKYQVKYDNFIVFVNDLTDQNTGTITAFTANLSTAELSDLGSNITVEGLNNPVYYFNRIKCRPEREGTGEGKALMIEICKLADKNGITILNELNPYGKRDMESLKEFFKASGFEEFNLDNTMVRRPKGAYESNSNF